MLEPLKSPVELEDARYAQPDVLLVTGIQKGMLQTWVNRGHIALTVQNPGYGRKRQYSAIDTLKIAIMSRFNDMSLPVSAAKGFAEDMADLVIVRNTNDSGFLWEEVFAIEPGTLKSNPARRGPSWWQRWGDIFQSQNAFYDLETRNALREARGSAFDSVPEWGEFIKRFDRVAENQMTDEEWRSLALRGIEQPTWLLIPIGYIVNSVLCRLATLETSA